jgi:type IV fimbrial biogenesis protein FimT
VALVVFGVLVALAVPAYTEFVRNSRRAAVLNEFVAALNLARSEAVKRGSPVAVCRTATGTSCGGGWTGGWLVFVNLDGDSPAVVDAPQEAVLRVYLAESSAYSLTPNNPFTNFIAYQPNGGTNNTAGRFTYCDARGLRSARAVIVNITGRPRLSQDTDGDGVHEDEGGADLACG